MADPDIAAVSFCAGYGGLDIGFDAACEHLGIAARTVAYVEWEGYVASQLLARMEDEALAPAPVWCGDLGRLRGADFRGRIDALLAGFPCQPHSHAGNREGITDDRWIWPAIARFIRESGVWLVVLENVPGLLSSGGFGPVLADLAEMGFIAESGSISAASVGASHKRERVFIVAYLPCERWQQRLSEQQGQQRKPASDQRQRPMADADGSERRSLCIGRARGVEGQKAGRCEEDGRAGIADQALADAEHGDRDGKPVHARSGGEGLGARHADRASAEGELADAERGRQQDVTKLSTQGRQSDARVRCGRMADSDSARYEGGGSW